MREGRLMLTKRIIPCLDVTLDEAGGCVVKGIEFEDLRRAGDPVELAKSIIGKVLMNWFSWTLPHPMRAVIP